MIKIGDTVHVKFNTAGVVLCYSAEVIAIPCATGDSWIFEDHKTKQMHYVSEGCTVSKRQEA